MLDNTWTLLEGEALAKCLRVLSNCVSQHMVDTSNFYSKKFGRKTIFARDHGVWTFYVVGDDGRIYSEKCCGLPNDFNLLLVTAVRGPQTGLLNCGVYFNGMAGE